MSIHRCMQIAAIGALFAAVADAAYAQLIGPIPPATPPTPDYVPGPRTPAAEGPPPTPEIVPVAPSIVQRAPDGRLKPIVGTPDEAAVVGSPGTELEFAL